MYKRQVISRTCFPGTGAGSYSGFDFVSPAPDDDWQTSDGFTFAMRANLIGDGILVQPLLKVRKATGQVVMRKSTTGEAFLPLSGSGLWQDFEYTAYPLAVGEQVVAVHIRVFIPNANTLGPTNEAQVGLDDVVPN